MSRNLTAGASRHAEHLPIETGLMKCSIPNEVRPGDKLRSVILSRIICLVKTIDDSSMSLLRILTNKTLENQWKPGARVALLEPLGRMLTDVEFAEDIEDGGPAKKRKRCFSEDVDRKEDEELDDEGGNELKKQKQSSLAGAIENWECEFDYEGWKESRSSRMLPVAGGITGVPGSMPTVKTKLYIPSDYWPERTVVYEREVLLLQLTEDPSWLNIVQTVADGWVSAIDPDSFLIFASSASDHEYPVTDKNVGLTIDAINAVKGQGWCIAVDGSSLFTPPSSPVLDDRDIDLRLFLTRSFGEANVDCEAATVPDSQSAKDGEGEPAHSTGYSGSLGRRHCLREDDPISTVEGTDASQRSETDDSSSARRSLLHSIWRG